MWNWLRVTELNVCCKKPLHKINCLWVGTKYFSIVLSHMWVNVELQKRMTSCYFPAITFRGHYFVNWIKINSHTHFTSRIANLWHVPKLVHCMITFQWILSINLHFTLVCYRVAIYLFFEIFFILYFWPPQFSLAWF